jgi:proteasome alpha subunit
MAASEQFRYQPFYGPEGRMTLVERALEAVARGGLCVGVRFPKYAVVASMVKPVRKLIQPSEKVFQIDEHVGVTGAGYLSDLYKLVDQMRVEAQRHRLTYGTPIDIGSLVQSISEYFHSYTIYPVRPQGISVIVAGADRLGVHLYQVDPSGTAFKGEAFAVGQESEKAVEELEQRYRHDMAVEEALRLIHEVMKGVGALEPLIQYGVVDGYKRIFEKKNHQKA